MVRMDRLEENGKEIKEENSPTLMSAAPGLG